MTYYIVEIRITTGGNKALFLLETHTRLTDATTRLHEIQTNNPTMMLQLLVVVS